MPNVTVTKCSVLNPATLLSSPGDGEEHNCVDVLQQVCPPRPNLKQKPLTNQNLASGCLPCDGSAHAAELIALAQACKLAEGKNVTLM